MRSLGKIFFYTLVVLLTGALMAPLSWHLIHALPAGWLLGLAGDVQRMPFHRYLSRSIQVTAILLLWPLIRSLHIRSLEELGLHRNPHALGDVGLGLAAGIPSGLLLVSALLISGAFELHSSWSVSVLPRILLSAVVVAVLEEFLFRGVILGCLRQVLGNGTAIFASAAIFAGLHFLNLPSSNLAGETPRWWSGLASLGTMGRTLPSWPIMAWALGTLLFAGIILGWMTTRTGSLWASIALHACWIFGQQFFNNITSYRHIPADAFLPFTGPAQCHGAVPIGLDALFSLLLAGALSVSLMRRRPRPREFVVTQFPR